MLTQTQQAAVAQWYTRPEVLDGARQLYEANEPERLEAFLHKEALLPLGRHDTLPDYMRDDEGGPLFPDNLSPMADEASWQDAIEIGWQVIERELGFSHDDVHRAVATEQQDDWAAFLASVEQRKNERG
jgi:hypothetical protein